MPSISAAASPPGFTPSTIILNDYAKYFVTHANTQIGPWLLGTFADMFLQGILIAQTTKYFTYDTGDSSNRRFVYLVLFLSVLCILKSAQNINVVWTTVVTNFANPDAAMMLPALDWWHFTSCLSTAIIASVVQTFFIYRYWLLTKRLWVCAIIAMAVVTSLAASSVVVYYLVKMDIPTVDKWGIVHFTSAIFADTLITILTAYHLYRQKAIVYSAAASASPSYASYLGRTTLETNVVQSTSQMIDRLLRMIWQSALPPLLCVIVNVSVLLALPIELTHMIFNMALPKLYAISLMYTLNVGIEMRSERMSNNGLSTNRESKSRNAPTPFTLRLGSEPSGVDGDTELPTRRSVGLQAQYEREVWDTSK